MKNKIKKWVCLILVVATCVIVDAPVVYAQGLSAINTCAPAPTYDTNANQTEWVYKVVNGVVWRRKWDLVKERWIGDWEIVP